MITIEDSVDLATPTGTMRTFRFRPAAEGRYPGIALFAEIYQITEPIQRAARMLAGHGYIVAAPESYHEYEPLGTPLAYDADGTARGNRYKIEKPVAAFDSDARTVLDHLASLPDCNRRLGAMGICLGGHLSFRAAFNPDVLASVCLYATDIHTRTLGLGKSDDSLARVGDIRGELLIIWGRQDPHIDRAGRRLIYERLSDAGVHFGWHEFNAQHAFIRDQGYRYDPALARVSWELTLELFARRLLLGQPFAAHAAGGKGGC